MRNLKKSALISLVGLFLIALPLAVWAADQQFGQSVYVAEDEIVEGNLIKAGNVIDISGAVNGDVIVAGNSINISGPVAGDVIAAGNIVRISGPVAGSVRVAASSVEINTEVSHIVWAVGSSVFISENSKVGWDVYAAGANVEIKGPVKGNVWASGASISIANEVAKDVVVSVDTEGEIILSPKAKVSGNLIYKAASEKQLVLRQGAEVAGEITKKTVATPAKFHLSNVLGATYIFFKVISLFSLLVIGLVLIALVPKIILNVKEEMMKRPGLSLGWGLVYLIVTPIVAGLLMITIIGLPLGLMIIPLYIIALYVSKVIAALVIGSLLLDRLTKSNKAKGSLIWPLILGVLIFVIVTSIPVIGWAIKLILVLWALGAVVQIKKDILKEFR